MGIRIYNTLTGQKEEFMPLNPPEVKMYVCGPTVYDEPHIGHLRSAYVFEVMRRWMEHSGYKVKFVRNVTDVDDKIIDKARQEGGDLKAATTAVSSKYFDLYKKDLAALGIQEPTVEPRATTHVAQMQKLIGELIQKGFAYHVAGSSDVYFEVKKFSLYGKLSKQKIDEMMDQARKESAPGKRDPLDFALWKGAKADEPAWDSPWGLGRPGWHIECSAMNKECLGEQIDIHGGGLDLKFPHHENEIAQSEAASGKIFAKYWIHHGLVTVEGQKMSKSLKNFTTLKSIESKYFEGEAALKLLFLSTHYSSSLDYSEANLQRQQAVWKNFYNFFNEVNQLKEGGAVTSKSNDELNKLWDEYVSALNDDFNTPKALALTFEMMNVARKNLQPEHLFFVAEKISESFKTIFGLFAGWNETAFFSALGRRIISKDDSNFDRKIQGFISERAIARSNKQFDQADLIRKRVLEELRAELVDWKNGRTTWRPKL